MRKKVLWAVISILAVLCILLAAAAVKANRQNDLFTAAVVRLLDPQLEHYVREQYGESAMVAFYDTEIEKIERVTGGMKLTVVIYPYTGPHNYISKDQVALLVRAGEVNLLDYRQVEVSPY